MKWPKSVMIFVGAKWQHWYLIYPSKVNLHRKILMWLPVKWTLRPTFWISEPKWTEWNVFFFRNSNINGTYKQIIQNWRIKYKKFGYYCIIICSWCNIHFSLSLLISFEQSWTRDIGFKEGNTVPFNWCSRNKITKQINTKPLHMAT